MNQLETRPAGSDWFTVDSREVLVATIHHHIPGRTRLRLAVSPSVALRQVEAHLAELGAQIVRASATTRSVLVSHDPAISAEAVLEAVRAGLLGQHPKRVAPTGESEPDDMERPCCAQIADIYGEFESGADGLTATAAAQRLAQFGANSPPTPHGRSQIDMLRAQITTFPVALLMGSALLSLATGGLFDAAVTIGVVLANAGIGFSSENSSERLIRRLSKPIEHQAEVLRDGARISLLARMIVPGDVVLLEPGFMVPADARVIEAHDLSVDESSLTGESLPVSKQAETLPRAPDAVSERSNLLHAGTVVTGGNGRAIVVRTGARTELARTRALIGLAAPPRPEIEKKLAMLSRQAAAACLGASGLMFVAGLLRGEPLLAMAKSAIALVVSAIPEGLPAVATTSLASAARAMERERGLVRVLPAVESLATIDTLCLDKTGTLTENRMKVVAAHVAGKLHEGDGWERDAASELQALAEALILCNEAHLASNTGSATEIALLHFSRSVGLDPDALQQQAPILAIRNRNHERRWMATEHHLNGDCRVAVKGAPDELIALATQVTAGGQVQPLSDAAREEILRVNETLASKGLRVLGVARRQGPLSAPSGSDLVWLGLVALADPIRPEAREAIETFHKAGIRTVMITGDQPATALAVAESLALSRTGIIPVVDGAHIAGLDEKELGALALKTSVFARVSPADKLQIVRGLQAIGKRVAMIGDGVNDGPALRAAAVGIAMGRNGTDVAREVADIVIADDDLRALGRAIARGRATEESIRHASFYLLSTNFSELLVMLAETLHSPRDAETPMELFWLNLVTDVLPALGLALADSRSGVMARPPRSSDAALFSPQETRMMARDATGMAIAALAAHFAVSARLGPGPRTRAVTFLTLALAQIAQAWVPRDRAHLEGAASSESERRLEAALGASGALLSVPFLARPIGRMLGIGSPGLGGMLLSTALAALSYHTSQRRRVIRRISATAAPSPVSRPVRTRSTRVRRSARARAERRPQQATG